VRSFSSNIRTNEAAVLTSWGATSIASKSVAHQVSKENNRSLACSALSSPTRTRRETAEETSAAAKSLIIGRPTAVARNPTTAAREGSFIITGTSALASR